MNHRLHEVALVFAVCAILPLPAQAQTVPPMTIENDVVVGSLTSDRFTWRDSSNRPRVAVLPHNTGQTGPGGTRGGELREFRYETAAGTRVVTAASTSAASGFGYVVSHPSGGMACMAGYDSSWLGHFVTGTFTRLFAGPHHAILRFTQSYPRVCRTGGTPPAEPIGIPVTIDWVFATGRDHPLWAVTWDLSGVPAGTLNDDARGPYGELLFDGASTEGAHGQIAGVAWGDRYKFTTTTNPVTLNSTWTWNVPNSVPYVKLWTTATDATMGVVQTQTITQQDAGGYWGVSRWNTTSAGGNACTVAIGGVDHLMPCTFNWPYQSINYSLVNTASTTNNTRLAWGTNFGFLGQSSYYVHGSSYYGGPLPNSTAPGWPKKSYSTYVVLGTHTSGPVEAQVTQIETIQSLTFTPTIGSVAASGPAGVGRADTVSYAPAGYDHVYGALAFGASSNRVDVNVAVGAGTLRNPLVIVRNYTAGSIPPVKLGGASLLPDVDYFASLRPSASELWITLNRNISGATNRLEIGGVSSVPGAPTIGAATAGPSSARIAFTPPASDGGSPITGYTATCGPGNHTATGSASPLYVRGLTAGTQYTCTVAATNAIGTGPSSGSVSVIPLPGTLRGDMNGDGRADLLWRNAELGQNALWVMDGLTVSSSAYLAAVSRSWRMEGIGDFNGDGRADLLWHHSLSGDVVIWLMNGSTITSSATVATPHLSWVVQSVGDFDGNGRTDILWRNSSTSEAVVWLMDGLTIASGASVASPSSNWSVQGVGDFNLDGRADILWRNSSSSEAWVWMMDGAAIAATGYVASPHSSWVVKGVGDFSGDGRADILWRNESTSQAVVWVMSGAAITSSAYVATPSAAWDASAVGDFDGDGRADMMWRNTSTGENVVWLMNGTAIHQAGYIPTVTDQGWKVAGPR